jgi:hypothetical protein
LKNAFSSDEASLPAARASRDAFSRYLSVTVTVIAAD